MSQIKRCWIEVDLDALRNNLSWIRYAAGQDKRIMTIVKADAYGHGLKSIATQLMQSGTDFFGVANLEEAHTIRQIGRQWPILMLGACLPGELEQAIRMQVHLTVSNAEQARKIARTAEKINKSVQLHLKVDTGMSRLGARPHEALEVLQAVQGHPLLVWKGAFTHFADAESDLTFSRLQRNRFQKTLDRIRSGLPDLEWIHASNSGSLVYDKGVMGNMVRPGLLTYGIVPEGTRCPVSPSTWNNLRPALSFHARISLLKVVRKGASISYGRTCRAKKAMRIATVSAGYGDGYPWAASNRFHVLVRGRRCPILGRITMDQMLVDVTSVGDVQIEDEVTLIGRNASEQITTSDLARAAGTIPWHILTSLTYRVTRHYKGTWAS